MLDRTAEIIAPNAEARTPGEPAARAARKRFGAILPLGALDLAVLRQAELLQPHPPHRLLNLAGLVALVIGVLYLSQFRAGLIDARVQSLLVQSEIIAGAIAASATADNDTITIDPDRLLELQAGQSYGPTDDALSSVEFPINPERVAPVLRRLVSPTKTRARIYDRDGVLILDSRNLYGRGDVLRFDLPAPNAEKPGLMERAFIALRRWLGRGDLPLYKELGPENGKGYPEVGQALDGLHASMVRVNDRGEVIVSVAVPVQRFRAVRGALMLSTQGADIDDMVEAERLAIFKVFLIAAGVMVVLSMLLAGTIAGPVRRLADSAERVRRRIRSARRDSRLHPAARRDRPSVGRAARHDRRALYPHRGDRKLCRRRGARIAESAHLAALGGGDAADGQDRCKPQAAAGGHRARRQTARPADLRHFRRQPARRRIAAAGGEPGRSRQSARRAGGRANEVRNDDVTVTLAFEGGSRTSFKVPGHDLRIGQVVSNLIDNARSFSPPGGKVRVTCRKLKDEVEIVVDDDGPGIRPDALQKIFERFYTDRPDHGFGQNSGLGLSISKQIIEAHGGSIWVENRSAPAADGEDEPQCSAPAFIVRLPAK